MSKSFGSSAAPIPTEQAVQPVLTDFWRDAREGQYEVVFRVQGTIRENLRAESIEQARALAAAMSEGGDLELYSDHFDDVRIDWVRPCPPMYLVLRDGKEWGVSHIQPGDQPREPNGTYEAAKYTIAPTTTASSVGTKAEGRSAPNPTGESTQ